MGRGSAWLPGVRRRRCPIDWKEVDVSGFGLSSGKNRFERRSGSYGLEGRLTRIYAMDSTAVEPSGMDLQRLVTVFDLRPSLKRVGSQLCLDEGRWRLWVV